MLKLIFVFVESRHFLIVQDYNFYRSTAVIAKNDCALFIIRHTKQEIISNRNYLNTYTIEKYYIRKS